MKSVIKRLGFKNITVHKQTSAMTVLSIALSVAMTTMVVALLFGVFKQIEQSILHDSSQYNVSFQGVSNAKDLVEALGDDVEGYYSTNYDYYTGEDYSVTVIQTDFHSKYKMMSSQSKEKYPTIQSMLAKGRLSENSSEIVLSYYDAEQLGSSIGDSLTIESHSEGDILPARQVEVVGVFNDSWEARTYIQETEIERVYELFIQFKPGTRNIEKIVEAADVNRFAGDVFGRKESTLKPFYNEDYNTILGMQSKLSGTKAILAGASLVFIGILSLATFSLIFNAFNSNVERQIHNYGLLRSIGATKKQLKAIIRIEGYTLTFMGLVLGLIVGYGFASGIAWYIMHQINYATKTFGFVFPYDFKAVLPMLGVCAVIIISFVIVTIPLNRSISKLFKMTSVESIRDSNRYRKSKRVKKTRNLEGNITSQLAYRFTQSDKSRFKGIKTSLVVSIVIFIALMSFIKIGFKQSESLDISEHNVEIRDSGKRMGGDSLALKTRLEDVDILFEEISDKIESVHRYLWFAGTLVDDTGSPLPLEEFVEANTFWGPMPTRTEIVFADAPAFEKMVIENEGDIASVKSILMNTYDGRLSDGTLESNVEYNGSVYLLNTGDPVTLAAYDYNDETNTYDLIPGPRFTVDMIVDTLPKNVNRVTYFSDVPNPVLIMPDTQLDVVMRFFDGESLQTKESGFYDFVYKVLAKDSLVVTQYFEEADGFYVMNLEKQEASVRLVRTTMERIITAILIFIGSVCILNMISITLSNNNLRRKDFAGLKSVGMSQKSLNLMLFKEALMIVGKPIIIGTALGAVCSYIFVIVMNSMTRAKTFAFAMDIKAVFISWLLALIIVIVNSVITIHHSKKYSIIDDLRRVS